MGGGSRRRGRRVTGKHAPRPALPRPRLPRRPHPRPAQSPGASLTDTHYSPEPGRRPAGSTCPARRGAASGLGVSSPRPALHPGPPPGPALRPAPCARGPALAVPASLLRPEPRGEGRAALSAPGVIRSLPAAKLPKHTARVRRRTEGGGGWGGCGERGRQSPAPAERAAPPGQRAMERVSWPRMPVPAPGSAVLRERSLPGAQGRAAACALALRVPRFRIVRILFAYPAGAARKRLQPRGTLLGEVEPPGGVQLPKAPLPWSEKAAVGQPCCQKFLQTSARSSHLGRELWLA